MADEVEPYTVPLDPETDALLKLYLVKNVRNLETVRENVISGEWNCTVIKPSLILDPFQVAVAVNKASVAGLQNSMVTRTIFTEVLFCLSISKKITQSLVKFGIGEDTNLLVCFIVTDEVDPSEEIMDMIHGEVCDMSELPNFTDMESVKSEYKLDNVPTVEWLNVIVSRIATKNIISY